MPAVNTPQPLQADFRPGPALAPPLRFPGTQAPHPYSAFHLFSPHPQKSRGVGRDESYQGGPGRGGDRLSGTLYSCSSNTNSGGDGKEKTRPLKLLVV